MKRTFLAIAVLLLSIATNSFALNNLDEISTALENKQTPDIRAKLVPFILANKDASQRDVKLMKVLDRAQLMVIQDLIKKYDAKPENYEQKIGTKEDRELYKVVLDLGKKRAYRGYLLCKGNLDDAIKSAQKSSELSSQAYKFTPTSDEFIAMQEQVLSECQYDEKAIWPLIVAYRYNSKRKDYRDKYTKLWLRIIKEDQVEFDYSGSPPNAWKSHFRTEFKTFLNNNNMRNKLILTKEQVQFIAEKTISKYPNIFTLEGIRISDEAYYEVSDMIVLPYWLNYYKLYDLRAKFIDTFITDDLARQTIKDYARNPQGFDDFKEIFDYMESHKVTYKTSTSNLPVRIDEPAGEYGE
jgi:hypothetical protein